MRGTLCSTCSVQPNLLQGLSVVSKGKKAVLIGWRYSFNFPAHTDTVEALSSEQIDTAQTVLLWRG